MASHYTRKGSPFHWVRFQKADGTWGGKSSLIRLDAPGSVRKVKQYVATLTLLEHQGDAAGGSHRFDVWVPGFLKDRYKNPKTLTRYLNAWSALCTYLEHRDVISPSQVTYQLCVDYPKFRTHPPKGLMRGRSWNTALTELKVLSAILQEAVRRGHIAGNPSQRLGLQRTPAKQKPEITDEETIKVEKALATRDEWMADCWLVAMRQGCRLSETAAPLSNIDDAAQTITFNGKGGRIHTAPLHPDLFALVAKARKERRRTLVELPEYAAKKWHQFFRRIGLPHLSFHCTRVTVVTKLARQGAPIYQTKTYVGHASETVHRIYQRLTPCDVRHLGAVLSSPSGGSRGFAPTTAKPIRRSKARQA